MNKSKLAVLFFIFSLFWIVCSYAQTNLPVGTIRKPIMTDGGGTVISTNIVFTNQVIMVPAPAISNQLVRLMDLPASLTGVAFLASNNVFSATTTNTFPGFINVTNISIKTIRSTLGVQLASFDDNFGDTVLNYTNGNTAVLINMVNSGIDLFDNNGNLQLRLGAAGNFWKSAGGAPSIQVDDRNLFNPAGNLSFSWSGPVNTNAINLLVLGTNSANAYSVKGQLGFTGAVTNLMGSGISNVTVYVTGVVTNNFTIP